MVPYPCWERDVRTHRGISLVVIALLALVAGAGYLLHEQSLQVAEVIARQAEMRGDHRYTHDMAAALRFAKADKWAQARQSLAGAAVIRRSQQVRALQSVLRQLDGSELGVEVRPYRTGLGVTVVRVAAKSAAAEAGIVAGDLLLSGSLKKAQIGSYNAALRTTLHLQGLIESARPGQRVFLQIKSASGRVHTLVVRVQPAPAGMPWIVGPYTQSSFGDSITLPTLWDRGIPFGWQLALPAPADGSGRVFFDPADPLVSVSVYGYNNILNWTLLSQVPPTAVVINDRENIMGSPGVMYKDIIQDHGQSVVQETLLMGGPSYRSFDGVTVSVPESQIASWMPVMNGVLNSFTPGNLAYSG